MIAILQKLDNFTGLCLLDNQVRLDEFKKLVATKGTADAIIKSRFPFGISARSLCYHSNRYEITDPLKNFFTGVCDTYIKRIAIRSTLNRTKLLFFGQVSNYFKRLFTLFAFKSNSPSQFNFEHRGFCMSSAFPGTESLRYLVGFECLRAMFAYLHISNIPIDDHNARVKT